MLRAPALRTSALRGSAFLAAALLAAPALAASHAEKGNDHDHGTETRELDAHVHGHGTLTIAIEGSGVEMELALPGASAVGFEHAAETDEQRAAVDEAIATLRDPMSVFALPPAAGCTVGTAEAELHQDGDHNEFEAAYALTCEDAGALTSIETTLFERFEPLEELEVEFATPAGQGATELERGDTTISLATS